MLICLRCHLLLPPRHPSSNTSYISCRRNECYQTVTLTQELLQRARDEDCRYILVIIPVNKYRQIQNRTYRMYEGSQFASRWYTGCSSSVGSYCSSCHSLSQTSWELWAGWLSGMVLDSYPGAPGLESRSGDLSFWLTILVRLSSALPGKFWDSTLILSLPFLTKCF
jgi:hypothetical protein